METTNFDSLINGGELILTTGVGLQLEKSLQVQYMKKMIERDVAAICIEFSPHFNNIPLEVLEIANLSEFPIIIFEEVVKFVDITQDLHTLIINQHHDILSNLDRMSRKFISLSLEYNGVLKILEELQAFFNENTFFVGSDLKSYYYPPESKGTLNIIQDFIIPDLNESHSQIITSTQGYSFALMPVRVLGQTWGHLCIQITQPYSEEFLFLMLDRATLAIAQVILRNRTIEERKQHMEDEFVRNLLVGREFDQTDLQTYLPAPNKNMHFRVFIIRLDASEESLKGRDWEEINLHRSMLIRTLFKEKGFLPAVSVKKNEIAIVASFPATENTGLNVNRFNQVIKMILEMNHSLFFDGGSCRIGISTTYSNLLDATTGYKEANKVLSLYDAGIVTSNYYEDLGVYRLLSLNNHEYLNTYINQYLTPLLEYDNNTDSNLLETLMIYLECQGSKKETSERLFIVRQTLYHRLDRIEQLLGENYLSTSNRLALEVAIKAYPLLQKNLV